MVLKRIVTGRSSSAAFALMGILSIAGGIANASCASSGARAPQTPTITLADTTGGHTSLPQDLSKSKFTVVVFYADHCPCFRVHEDRLRELAKSYAPQGVGFLFVDSEIDAELQRDVDSVRERSLPTIAIDPGAKLADALGAEYATYTVILDGTGRVHYRGGVDSDKNRLTDGARTYLKDALDDLLAGREPRVAEGKALGCALQTR